MRRLAAIAVVLVCLAGCEGPHEQAFPPPEREPAPAPAPLPPAVPLPDAMLVRFQEVTGTGFSRESWEIEVLQMGSDVRIRGSLRTGGTSVALYRPMDRGEFVRFWEWIRKFPLDRFQVKEDPDAAPPGWRKRLKYDAVLGPSDRQLSENEWSRPPVGAPWLQEIEDHLHVLALDLAEQEVRSAEGDTGSAAEPPGGAPDAE